MRRYQNSNYLISEQGFIVNEKTQKRLKPQNNGNGYLKVSMRIDGREVQRYVHRLVGEAFLSKTSIQINHKDGNKSNNHIDNLEWVTNSENQIHAHKTGLKKNGNQLWNGKFTKDQVEEMKVLRKNGMKYYKIAELFNTTKGTTHAIINGNRYKYI